MSIYSTIKITRTAALKLYLVQQLDLQISDEELEAFLDEYLEPKLYNAILVNDDEENDDYILR